MRSVAELESALAEVSPALLADVAHLDGDLVILGAGGKLGPSLVHLACRAITQAGTRTAVHAVSRFGTPGLAEQLASYGAQVHHADLSTPEGLARLPPAAHVIFLVGSKFGTDGNESATWATNTYLPGRVAEQFPGARMVALSTGNVYPLRDVTEGGSTESDPVGPVGEYAMSCLGRERVLTHVAQRDQTSLVVIRLNYAVEMRYGVLVDLASRIAAGAAIDLTMGHANVVWQGYCNEVILRSLRHASLPPLVLNLTGPEIVSIRDAARELGAAMGMPVHFTGTEAPTALLSDASLCHQLFGSARLSTEHLIPLTADWVRAGLPLLGRPTHFQTRDGRF